MKAQRAAPPTVLMLGTALDGHGGIATILGVLRTDGFFERESVCYLATHADGTRWRKLGAALSGATRLLLMLLRERPAVVHVHAASRASFVRKSLLLLAARLAGCRTVFHLHGANFRHYATVHAGPLLRWWIRHTFEASSVVIALSENWAGFVRTTAPRARVVVVPNGVPSDAINAAAGAAPTAADEQAARILFLGRADPIKGIGDLLAAVAALVPAFPDLQLVIGGPDDAMELRRDAAALGIADRVVLPGWLDATAKRAELARAAVFCLPSHAEGLPLAMLEAMAAAKAVVVTGVGAMPEVVDDGVNGLVVPPRDVGALTAALARVLADDALRAMLGRNARATVAAHYSAAAVSARLAALYRELALPCAPAPPGRLRWTVNRLRCMTAAEVAHRMLRAAMATIEKRRLPLAAPPLQAWPTPGSAPPADRGWPPLYPDVTGAPALAPDDVAALLADADRICAGQITVYAAQVVDVGMAPDWHRDPASGLVGPSIYAGDIVVGDAAQVGDIKLVWEINRHQQWVRLAQAIALGAGARSEQGAHAHQAHHAPAAGPHAHYVQVLRTQLRGWLDQCPPMIGPNWASPLELGLRLISWSLVWRLAGGADGALFAGGQGTALRADWLASIHAHCRGIARQLSRHSSANNHLIGELAGLYVGAATWPCWPACGRWRARARDELAREAVRQYSRDGVNREHAFGYHVFSTELLFVAALAGQSHGEPFARPLWMALQRALRFLRSVRDVGGHVPQVGDADAAMAWRLDPRTDAARAALLLDLGTQVLDAADQRAAPTPTVRWLLHAFPGPRPRMAPLMPSTSWAFPDGGYLLFGSAFGSAREIKGLFDCAPLGYLGIAAHGHADALAVTLSVAGEPCLIDPGTYSYWAEPAWRDYFRGTAAHNTVRVDGVDQSVSGGRFMWLRKAAVTIERMPHGPARFGCRASHDGYRRLLDPVTHTRTVVFDARTSALCVTDVVRARRPHRAELFWHFAPGLDVRLDGNRVRVRGKAFTLILLVLGNDMQKILLYGTENPPNGWYSCTYGQKQPCHVLKITTLSSAGPIECRFTMSFD
jgi:glycosyltransferase involved in cell wall biosynthesis